MSELRNQINESIARRVEIENYLFGVYSGLNKPPSKEDCKILALRLGTPKEFWSETVKNYIFKKRAE